MVLTADVAEVADEVESGSGADVVAAVVVAAIVEDEVDVDVDVDVVTVSNVIVDAPLLHAVSATVPISAARANQR